jgi:hypothetical protein
LKRDVLEDRLRNDPQEVKRKKTDETQHPYQIWSGCSDAFQVGYRYYVDGPNGGPDWGLRFAITLLFPKK